MLAYLTYLGSPAAHPLEPRNRWQRAGLGSDTGGSIRIPAAHNGIVGFKSTARLVPTLGTRPLSPTLDTVCALTRAVPDALIAHELLSQRWVTRNSAPIGAYRLGIASTVMIDGLDTTPGSATLQTLRDASARIDKLTLSEINELSQIQASGGFSAAESYAGTGLCSKIKLKTMIPASMPASSGVRQ